VRLLRTESCARRGTAHLARVLRAYPPDGYDYVCLTGRRHKTLVNLPTVTEPEAVERALQYVRGRHASAVTGLLSLGSENFIFYEVNADGALAGVRTGNKCASGTGEFLLQQVGRMDLTLDEAIERARGARPYSVCGRCSVFCKSDCTRLAQVPRRRVAAGWATIMRRSGLSAPARRAVLVGGWQRRDGRIGAWTACHRPGLRSSGFGAGLAPPGSTSTSGPRGVRAARIGLCVAGTARHARHHVVPGPGAGDPG
jgi:hypothetical protein